MLSTTIKFTLLAALLKLSSSQTENVAFTLWSRNSSPTSFIQYPIKYGTCSHYNLKPNFMVSTVSDAEISFFSDSQCTNLLAKKNICGSYGYKTPNGPPEIINSIYVIITKKDGICKYKRRRREC
ncbi:hypothetical protein AYI69_g2557 [Smittium culicis]|uniref:Uncharacterized protein n=1 Tax=Smittium culicis TaxID=133412 RepID=A0A1R1YMA3_9FUNG|nr:hypothetical protein AYI69_g2557 [Smittium culicis]